MIQLLMTRRPCCRSPSLLSTYDGRPPGGPVSASISYAFCRSALLFVMSFEPASRSQTGGDFVPAGAMGARNTDSNVMTTANRSRRLGGPSRARWVIDAVSQCRLE